MKPLTKNELRLAGKMLELASEAFSNHGCNDVEDSVYDGWTLEERQQFVKDFHEHNGDPQEYNPKYLHLGDSFIMSYLADRLMSV